MQYFINKTPESIATTGIFRKFEVTTNQITMTNLNNSSQEIWKDIPNYEGQYQISNLGRVKSLARTIQYKPGYKSGGIHTIKQDIILKNILKSSGYYVVKLSVGNKQTSIHRLIAENFIPNPTCLPHVNHINGIKTDNRIENLEWCTPRENNIHAYKSGLKNISEKQRLFIGNYSKIKKAKKVKQFDSNGIFINRYVSMVDAAEKTGCNKGTISACCRGKVKHANNFKFEY